MKVRLSFATVLVTGFLLTMFAFAYVSPKVGANADIDTPALSTTIVISQAYGGGGGTTGTYIFDYVELKNVSASPQSLNGLTLMYGSATGQFGSSATNLFVLPNVTVNPGQYYLVQTSSAGTAGAAFPVTPDATTTNMSMSGTNGKVALTNASFTANTCGATATPCTLPNSGILDVVSWGTANNAEGGASTNGGTSLTATQGNVRKSAGCTETDNNNSDFDVVTAPIPRNLATAASPCGSVRDAPMDINGDGKTDYVVVRAAGGTGSQLTWLNSFNSTGPDASRDWGISGDQLIAADYDGDGKDDETVFRPSNATFYIIQSSSLTMRVEQFGQTGDNPRVIGDYDGDGRDDLAVYRPGTQSTWFYKTSSTALFAAVDWGQTGDFPAPGDYDGDGKADFVVQRADGANGRFWKRLSGGTFSSEPFGQATDGVVPGDYDGDGKTDVAVFRTSNSLLVWDFEPSGTPGTTVVSDTWGVAGDLTVQGDYDGDGKTDYAVWRSGSPGTFYIMTVGTRNISSKPWGQTGDLPAARYNTF